MPSCERRFISYFSIAFFVPAIKRKTMKRKQILPQCAITALFFCGAVLAFALSGCATTYLQNLASEGPFFQPPVQMIHDTLQTITLHPSVSIVTPQTLTGRLAGHTQVNGNGIYEVDTINTPIPHYEDSGHNTHDFEGTNFYWNLPSVLYGLALDLPFSSTNSISLGGNYAPLNGEPYWQAYCMISNFSISSRHMAVRFDLGLEWQHLKYDVEFVRTISSLSDPTSVEFTELRQNQTSTNYFIVLTLNSVSQTSRVHLFLQAAGVRQTLFSISNVTGSQSYLNDETQTHYLYSLTPGFSVQLADNFSAVFGVRFVWDVSTESASQTLYQPLLQFDMGL
jgi:hypothetical protein